MMLEHPYAKFWKESKRSYSVYTSALRGAMKPLVTYIRVSTSQQGRSGLGIEAQRESLARFAETEGFDIIGEFVEVETGRAR
jgi:hypothetical protein